MITPEKLFVNEVFTAIKSVTGGGDVPLHAPSFGDSEMEFLGQCIKSTYVSSVGPFVEKFQDAISGFTGAKHVIATVNGTSALHLALLCAGVSPNDEVLVPAISFIATPNAVSYCNAIPHFIDSDPETLGIDLDALRKYLTKSTKLLLGQCINKSTGRTIKAIIPMHTFGHPNDMDNLLSIADEFNLEVVEDAAEAMGSYYKGRHAGTFGKLGVISFNGNKVITTGGGGAILTNDDEVARKARHLASTARLTHPWKIEHSDIGFNYRMPNLNAAIGLAQLLDLPEKLSHKRKLYNKYQTAFGEISNVKIFKEREETQSNYWLQVLMLERGTSRYRDEILETTNNAGIATRPIWGLMSDQLPYRSNPKMKLQGAELLSQKIINLPSSPNLGN